MHPRTITQIWNRFVETRRTDSPGGDVSIRKRNSGQKKRHASELEVVQNIPMERRSNLRSIAQLSGIPKKYVVLAVRQECNQESEYPREAHPYPEEQV